MFSSSEEKPGAFPYLIINALNQMVPSMLTSVTLNGVGLITAAAASIFPQSSHEHASLGSILWERAWESPIHIHREQPPHGEGGGSSLAPLRLASGNCLRQVEILFLKSVPEKS